MHEDPQAVVIGAGPNGLVAANLLADEGWDVVVLEAEPEPGGAVRSGALTEPGFVHDRFSAFYPLAVASPVMRALELERHGLRWCRAPLTLAHPTPDGRCAVIARDPEETAASLDAYAPGDGDGWRALYSRYQQAGRRALDAVLSPFPPLRAGAALATALGPRELADFARFALLPLRRLAEETFAGEGGAVLVGGNTMHTDLSPEQVGGAFLGWLLAGCAQEHGFPVPEGGASRLTDALVTRFESRGGRVMCNARAVKIDVRAGRAVGVRTADGTEIGATRAVLADVGAPALYAELVREESLPARIRRGMRRFQYDHATVKLDYALDGGVPWSVEAVRQAGTVHVVDSLDRLTQVGVQLASGYIPARPALVLGQMTTADPTRSPAGTETLWAYAHVPQRVRGDAGGELTGKWDDAETNAFAARVEAEIEAHAPGFAGRIRARHVASPPRLEAADANLVGGAVNGGTAQLHQQFVFRPTLGLGRAETPIRGLYLASASAHPGGAVHGACGANAARAAVWGERRRRFVCAFPSLRG